MTGVPGCRSGRGGSAPAEGRHTLAYAARSSRDQVVSVGTLMSSEAVVSGA